MSTELTPSEAAIYLYLADRPGRWVTPSALVVGALGYAVASGPHADGRTLASHICAIRRKLGREAVASRRGRGYALGPEAPPALERIPAARSPHGLRFAETFEMVRQTQEWCQAQRPSAAGWSSTTVRLWAKRRAG